MYVPPHFELSSPDIVREIIDRYSFATMITPHPDETKVTHLPCLYDPDRGEWGTIRGHVAKANSHWRLLEAAAETLIVFLGPHHYISSTWYEPTTTVPTWNYIAVHAYGRPAILDQARSAALLLDTARFFEPPDSVYDYEAGQREAAKLLPGIVAFEMPISRMQSKAKLSQNRSETDRGRVIERLRLQGDEAALDMAEMMDHLARDSRADRPRE